MATTAELRRLVAQHNWLKRRMSSTVFIDACRNQPALLPKVKIERHAVLEDFNAGTSRGPQPRAQQDRQSHGRNRTRGTTRRYHGSNRTQNRSKHSSAGMFPAHPKKPDRMDQKACGEADVGHDTWELEHRWDCSMRELSCRQSRLLCLELVSSVSSSNRRVRR